ncbi:MAG TPA: DUF427 domain-containing protein [Solirubrobacteraceae bacterium]|nr:DUF427 domain-containing protein [Solirubrobacteraceae bacterium]
MRAPGHRITVRPVPGRVVVRLDGEVLADTRDAVVLEEGRLPPRWYVPEADVRGERLEPSGHTSHCPFKGDAVYRSARVGERVEEAVAWSYPEPLPGVAGIAGRWCFYQDRVDVEVEAAA